MKPPLPIVWLALLATGVFAQAAPPERPTGAYIRVRDAAHGVRYLPMLDAAGNPTRFSLVNGKHGEPLQVRHTWGKHGEFTVYPVEADANGAVMFARAHAPAGESATVGTYVPAGSPASLPNRLNAAELVEPHRTYYPAPGGEPEQEASVRENAARATTPRSAVLPEGAEPSAPVTRLIHPIIPAGASPTPSDRGGKTPLPPPGDRVDIGGATWICGKPARPIRPAERIIADTSGDPAEALAIEAAICTRGAQNEAVRADVQSFICTMGLDPAHAGRVVSGLRELPSVPAAERPADVQSFVCSFGVKPADADRLVDYLCTKGPRPEDAREIQAFVCRLGYSPEEAPARLEGWCGTRMDAGQAAGRIEEICVLRVLPAQLRDDWTNGCVLRVQELGAELRPDDLIEAWDSLRVDPGLRGQVSAALPGFCGTNWADTRAIRRPGGEDAGIRETVSRAPPTAAYNPLDDVGDAPVSRAGADAAGAIFTQISEAHDQAARGRAGTGDEGGAVLQPTPVIGADVAAGTRAQREAFTQRPGAHAQDPEASLATGDPNPLGDFNEAIGAISGAIGGVQQAVDGVRDIDRQVDRLRGSGHRDEDDPRPAPELARPVGGAAPHTAAHTPPPAARAAGHTGTTVRPAPATARPAAAGHAHGDGPAAGAAHAASAAPPAGPTATRASGYFGFLVTLQGDFLGAGPADNYNSRRSNLEAQGRQMDWQVIQAGFSSSAAAHRWILDNSTPAASNSPYSGARVFRGQTVRVRANLESFAQ